MIFRQLFDSTSSTYTYIIAGRALIIDPVLDKTMHVKGGIDAWKKAGLPVQVVA